MNTNWIKIDSERCKACGLCIEACKHGCLGWGSQINRAGYLPAQIVAPASCIGCKLCLYTCPEPLCITSIETNAQNDSLPQNGDRNAKDGDVSAQNGDSTQKSAKPGQNGDRNAQNGDRNAQNGDSTQKSIDLDQNDSLLKNGDVSAQNGTPRTLRAFMKGNDAIVAGALAAGCRAFFGYPITPASEIAHDAMQLFESAGALAIQAESEIAAIHMLYGAGATGTMAMTATSGPGLSLMQDGLSYMAAAQIPGVVVDIMRAGPGLGNIGPEQSDYAMVVRGGGHGEYHIPVLAPASAREMFDMTREAFRIAFEYRTPVCILADAFIGQMMESLDIPETLPAASDIASAQFPFEARVDATPQTSSHIISTLDLVPESLAKKNDARFAHYDAMKSIARFEYTEFSPNCPSDEAPNAIHADIDTLVVAFGICARIAREAAQQAANAAHKRFAVLRPQTLWPIDGDAWHPYIERARKICVVECNRGMMRADLARFIDETRMYGICRDGGIVPTVEEIVAQLAS